MSHPHSTLFVSKENAARVAATLRNAGFEISEKETANRYAINIASDFAESNKVRRIINETIIDYCEKCN